MTAMTMQTNSKSKGITIVRATGRCARLESVTKVPKASRQMDSGLFDGTLHCTEALLSQRHPRGEMH